MRHRNRQAGQSLVFVALGMVVLIGILGLAIDIGYYRHVRRELQTAADAAALAGAMDLNYGDIATAGQAAAGENGFPNGGNTTVAIYHPPKDGPYAGSTFPTYVEAVVTQNNVPQFFSKVLGLKAITLSASAVAEGGLNCIYALDTANSGAISMAIARIQSACGVVDNSNLTGIAGGICAPSWQIVGSVEVFVGLCPGFRPTQPSPPTKITAVADPFANVPAPSVTNPPPACPNGGSTTVTVITKTVNPPTGPNYDCGGFVVNNRTGANAVTINPGSYWGNPPFKITNSTVTFAPGTYLITSTTAGTPGIQLASTFAFGFGGSTVKFGTGNYVIAGGIKDNNSFGSSIDFNYSPATASEFILDGGGLSLIGNHLTSGSSGQTTGGVMFYNTGTPGTGAVTSYGPINLYFSLSGFCGSNCILQAPTAGTYVGILFFQDRNNPQTANFVANATVGTVTYTGAYYFPDATTSFDFDFGNKAPYSFLVAKDISWLFAFTFNTDYSTLPNGSPLRQGSAVLVQ